MDDRTDPLQADPLQPSPGDEDGDGIPDDWERLHSPESDPSDVDGSTDPDGDDLFNFTESQIGTDPNRSDTDFDGISDGVENGWRLPRPAVRVWSPQPDYIGARAGRCRVKSRGREGSF